MQLTMRIQLRPRFVAQACAALAVTILASAAHAHFGMVIPSDNMVLQGESRELKVLFAFAHPFEPGERRKKG